MTGLGVEDKVVEECELGKPAGVIVCGYRVGYNSFRPKVEPSGGYSTVALAEVLESN